MIKKLTQIGNSWGIVIPKVFIELLKINPVTDRIEITATKDEIIIKKSKL